MGLVILWAGAHQGKIPYSQVGGHRHCASEDIKILVCHVISQD